MKLLKYNKNFKINYCGKIIVVKERKAWINGQYCMFRENYRLNLSTNDTRRLRQFMYSNPKCMKLKRKYKKFLLTGDLRPIHAKISRR